MISPKHLDMLSLRWDEIRDRTHFPSHTPVITDGKKNIRLTPRIFAIPVKQNEERMKELGLQGSTIFKWFQVLIISFKCPAPCTSPHIFCGWHSHRTPPCHQPGKAVIMSMTMSSYYDFIRPSRFELSHPHKQNMRNTNNKNKIIQKTVQARKSSATTHDQVCQMVLEIWLVFPGELLSLPNAILGRSERSWRLRLQTMISAQRQQNETPKTFTKTQNPWEFRFLQKAFSLPMTATLSATCATWKPKHWWIRWSKKNTCLVAQQKNNLPQITDI